MTASAQQIESLRRLCGGPRDGALLRISLANALLAAGEAAPAIAEIRRALVFDADYSAAWKLLGATFAAHGEHAAAMDAYRCGIDAAQRRGDKQAQKEMQVFLRRLEKAAGGA